MRPEGIPGERQTEFVRLIGPSGRRDRLTSMAEVGLELDAVHRFTFVN
jgi:hypothetical protein